MNAVLLDKMSGLKDLCEKYYVLRLELFGSAAKGEFIPGKSDLDFLVEFRRTEAMNVADQYFGLLEDLKKLFDCNVDLVMKKAMRNPYFIRSVNQTSVPLYAA
ncbi:MAG: nucleotidyltransferase domain-containing protein [Nitrospinae bacterium]|nr:nucleotidyltransferase domain-containing protein [Nitrospinota bacterium]